MTQPAPAENPQRVAEQVSSMELRDDSIDTQIATLRERCQRFSRSDQLTIIIAALRRREEHEQTSTAMRTKLQGLRQELEGRLPVGGAIPVPLTLQGLAAPILDPRSITGDGTQEQYWTWRNMLTSAGAGLIGLLGLRWMFDGEGIKGKISRFFAVALGWLGLAGLANARRLAVERPGGGTPPQRVSLFPQEASAAPVTVGSGPNAVSFVRVASGGTNEVQLAHGTERYRLALRTLGPVGSGQQATARLVNFSALVSGLSRGQDAASNPAFDVGSGPMLAGIPQLQLGERVLHLELDNNARGAIAAALQTPPNPPGSARSVVVPLRVDVRGLTDAQVGLLSQLSTARPPTQAGTVLTIHTTMLLEQIGGSAAPEATQPTAVNVAALSNQRLRNDQDRTVTLTVPAAQVISLQGATGSLAANTDGSLSASGVTVTRAGGQVTVTVARNAAPGSRSITIGSQTVSFTVEAPPAVPTALQTQLTNGTNLLASGSTQSLLVGTTYAFALPADPTFSVQQGTATSSAVTHAAISGGPDEVLSENSVGGLRVSVTKEGSTRHLIVRVAGPAGTPNSYAISVGATARSAIAVADR